MSSLFISDLHLRPEQPAIIEATVAFLAEQAGKIQALYILGDLFNTWLGDDIVPEEYLPLITQLQKLAKAGVHCHLMVGNRDFMVGQRFAERCGATLLSDPTIITLAGHPVLLVHGDSLCLDDTSYQRYRRWTRKRYLQKIFLRLPQRYRQGISDKIKQKSRQQKQFKTIVMMDVTHREVERVMALYEVRYLIHGHTHKPAIHHLENDKYRLVLGDWQPEPSWILFDEAGFQLIDARVPDDLSRLTIG